MGAGAIPVGFLIYRGLFLQNDQKEEKRAFMRLKLTWAVAELILCTHAALGKKSEMLNQSVLVLFMGLLLGISSVMAGFLIRTPPAPLDQKKQFSVGMSKQEKRRSILSLAYTIPFFILLSFFPNTFAPDGLMPFVHKTNTEGNVLDDLEIFIFRFEGASLAYCLGFLWNFSSLPKQLRRLSDTTRNPFILVFLRGFLDKTGNCDRRTFAVQLFVHLFICFKTSTSTTKPEEKIPDNKSATPKPVLVPDLKSEEFHTNQRNSIPRRNKLSE